MFCPPFSILLTLIVSHSFLFCRAEKKSPELLPLQPGDEAYDSAFDTEKDDGVTQPSAHSNVCAREWEYGTGDGRSLLGGAGKFPCSPRTESAPLPIVSQ